MSTNTFSVLSHLRATSKPTTNASVKMAVPVTKFTFGNGQNKAAWGDEESDEEIYSNENLHEEEEDRSEDQSDEESESESESEIEEESEDEVVNSSQSKTIVSEKKVIEQRTISKKEKKRLEMDELDAALAELGVPVEEKKPTKPELLQNEISNESVEPTETSTKKSKKKKKKNTKVKSDPDVENVQIVDIKEILKSKSTKKKTTSEAVQLAQAEAKKKTTDSKKKKNRDKSSYNQMPTK